MIYNTHRIAKISEDEDGKELSEEMNPSKNWEDIMSPLSFSLEAVITWEPYSGSGGNGQTYFSLPNREITGITMWDGNKYYITETYKTFKEVIPEHEDHSSFSKKIENRARIGYSGAIFVMSLTK